MWTISKEFTFDSGHHLEGLPAGHKCGNQHGHTYTVIVELKSPVLDKNGFVLDYNELKPIKDYIDTHLDHKYLNDVLIGNPTAELIALSLFEYFQHDFPQLSSISIKETQKTLARYEPANN